MQHDPPYAALLRDAVQHHRDGRFDEAERLYRLVLTADPHQPDIQHNLGAVLAQRGRLGGAVPHLKIAIEGRPGNSKYWSACLQVMQALGARAEMVELYRKLLAQQPGLAP